MKHSDRGGAAVKVLIILLLIIVAILGLATRIPTAATGELPDITQKNARQCETKLKLLAHNGEKGENFTAELTSRELNSFLQEGYILDGFEEIKKYTKQGRISVDDLRVKVASDEIFLMFKTYVKFKYVYVHLAGKLKTKVSTKGSRVILRVSKASIGRLPVPSGFAGFVASIVRPAEKPLGIDLPDYVKSVEIKGDKLVINVGK